MRQAEVKACDPGNFTQAFCDQFYAGTNDTCHAAVAAANCGDAMQVMENSCGGGGGDDDGGGDGGGGDCPDKMGEPCSLGTCFGGLTCGDRGNGNDICSKQCELGDCDKYAGCGGIDDWLCDTQQGVCLPF